MTKIKTRKVAMRRIIVSAIIFSVAFLGFSFPPQPSCYSCNSTGIVTCGKCSGNGQIRKRIQDRNNKRPRFTTVRCSSCNGTGKVVCSSCKGMPPHHGKPHGDFPPPHREKQTCTSCNGRGNVQCKEIRSVSADVEHFNTIGKLSKDMPKLPCFKMPM